ncbi:Selenoprotein K, putative [Pediculus humanus corporis]|uniref:Selenoprotein K, putative n=1 Tax=Pediculus humanus subsp. corporis TaxID=121224 RepID=E0VXG4_PEDHC|nr:Selenoprotein K, putative [Pediculus humanus corporis]EEB18070.1 Selenoprotein K, putative [Pediculus humanus corporis]
MVYINSDGTIGTRPWHKQISLFFWGFIHFITAFFQTLINPALNGKGDQYERNYRRPGGGGGGGPPGPPGRRVGRIATIQSCKAPMPGGG